jgi:hypothetical protein
LTAGTKKRGCQGQGESKDKGGRRRILPLKKVKVIDSIWHDAVKNNKELFGKRKKKKRKKYNFD